MGGILGERLRSQPTLRMQGKMHGLRRRFALGNAPEICAWAGGGSYPFQRITLRGHVSGTNRRSGACYSPPLWASVA